MADISDRNPQNVTGKFYNDNSCIDCDLCRVTAPRTFMRDDDEGLTYVWRQPTTEAELKLAIEAMQHCPTETIGDDGER